MPHYYWKCSLIVAVLVAWSFAHRPARAGDAMTSAQLANRINTQSAPFILDVRTPGEFAAGHIPGAINIPHTELRDRLSELMSHQNEETVLHCQTGPRAGVAQSILLRAGFTRTHTLIGHMQQWKANGYPIEY